MTRHISEDLLFRMAAEPVTDAGQRQVRLAQLARTLHKLYETTEQDIELFRTLQHTRIRLDAWLDDPQRIDMTAIRPFDPHGTDRNRIYRYRTGAARPLRRSTQAIRTAYPLDGNTRRIGRTDLRFAGNALHQ